MNIDRREDERQFYPGGKRIVATTDTSKGNVTSVNGNAGSVVLGPSDIGAVANDALAGEKIETNTIPKMRNAIYRIAQAMGATVAAIALCVQASAATVSVKTIPINDIDLDQNPSVVTNVTLDVSDLATKTETSNATNALWTVTTNAIQNALTEIPAPDLSEYAKTNHVHEGYVTIETVNETVTDALNTFTDQKTGVVWTGVMYDGNLYYVAVTNSPAPEAQE